MLINSHKTRKISLGSSVSYLVLHTLAILHDSTSFSFGRSSALAFFSLTCQKIRGKKTPTLFNYGSFALAVLGARAPVQN